jgi:HTH-type transcriptional regulator/antitoxin HigA
MTIKPIKTPDDYNVALAEIERIFDAKDDSEEFDKLDRLATLVEAYEAKHYPIEPPDPIAAIEYEMEKRGLSRRELEPLLGPSGRVSEVMNRRRPLTVAMMRRLHGQFGIPGDVLLSDYPLAASHGGSRKARG